MPPSSTCLFQSALAQEISAALRPVAPLVGLFDAARLLRSKPHLVRSLLAALVSNPLRLDELADRSSWHSNGFAKIKLIEARDFCVRLHIWPRGAVRQADVNPHGHRWDFASWIVAGQGTRETYYEETRADDPAGAIFLRCQHWPSDGPGSLRPRGHAWIRDVGMRCLPVGTVYGRARDALHTVAPVGDDLLVTLVVQGRAVDPWAPVFVDPDRLPSVSTSFISSADLRGLLADVVSVVG